jgi:uncharacterized integral membrane protein
MSDRQDHREQPDVRDDHGREPRDPLRSSRTSRAWLALVGLVVVLLLLVVFIAQNTRSVQVAFLGWDWHPPLSVALLVAVAGGMALAATAGTLRLWQVRRRVRRGP